MISHLIWYSNDFSYGDSVNNLQFIYISFLLLNIFYLIKHLFYKLFISDLFCNLKVYSMRN